MDLDELVFHPWTVQGPRDVLTFVRGSGSYVIDGDGRRHLDFGSQLVFTNLGHQHPRVVAATLAGDLEPIGMDGLDPSHRMRGLEKAGVLALRRHVLARDDPGQRRSRRR